MGILFQDGILWVTFSTLHVAAFYQGRHQVDRLFFSLDRRDRALTVQAAIFLKWCTERAGVGVYSDEGGRSDFSRPPPQKKKKIPRYLSRFDTHQRWLPVMQSLT